MSDIYFPLDPKGNSVANKVVGENHVLVNRPVRMAVPDYGAFFADSLVVTDLATNKALTKAQFRAGEHLPEESFRYGKRICSIVLITDATVSNNIAIGYQALGNWYNYSRSKLNALLLTLDAGSDTVDWDDVLDKPDLYSPVAPHLHHVTETYGAEYLMNAIDRIKAAAKITEDPARGRVLNFLKSSMTGAIGNIGAAANLAMQRHLLAADPHTQYAKRSDLALSLPLVRRPVGITPANGATAVKLETSFQGSSYYSLYGLIQKAAEFHISTRSDFGDIVAHVVLGSVQSFKPDILMPGSKTLYWRYRYQDTENQWSDWSPSNSFATVPPYPAKDTVLNTYCKTGTTEKHQTLADGFNGTYDKLVDAKSTDCGYVAPPAAGTKLREYCDGYTHHIVYADGNGGSNDVAVETNSAYCGYVAPPAAGTVLQTYCKGYDKYQRVADGKGGSNEQLVEQNSAYCNYVPPPSNPAAGTIIGYTCQGYDKYNKVADGNGGYTLQFAQGNATVCGYSPPAAGTLLGSYCQGYDLYRTYADGNGGSYSSLYQSNSSTCGYTAPASPSLGRPVFTSGNGGVLSDKNGSFSAPLSPMIVYDDPNNTVHYLQTNWVVYDSAGNQVYTNSDSSNPSPYVPASALQNGQTYTMYARYMTLAIGPSAYSPGISFTTNWATNPPAGTVLNTYCNVYDKYQTVADGNGGFTTQLVEHNSSYCGYVDPIDPGISSIPSYLGAYGTGSAAIVRFVLNGSGGWSTYGSPTSDNGGLSGRYLKGNASGWEVYVTQNYVSGDESYSVSPGQDQWLDLSGGMSIGGVNSVANGTEPGELSESVFSVSIRNTSLGASAGFSIRIRCAGGCFAVGTVIRTPHGDTVVEALTINELVTSFDEPTMIDSSVEGWEQWCITETTKVNTHRESKVVGNFQFVAEESVKINGLHCTWTHTHFVFDTKQRVYCWKMSKDISLHDEFIDSNLNHVSITSIVPVTEPTTFVALDVEDIDTYQVKYGASYILTHNRS